MALHHYLCTPNHRNTDYTIISMKLLVCISKAPDTTSRIAFTDGDTSFDESGVQFIVNPYDEWYALVRAIELVEAEGGSVTTITVGDASSDPIIRKALAIGANDAVRINAEPKDSTQVARLIADYASDKGYDIILCGKETINHNSAAVGAMIAECLDMPFVPCANSLNVDGGSYNLTCETAGGTSKVVVNSSFVLSAAKGMSEQRIPNMRGIMSARTKPLQVVESTNDGATTNVVKFALPPAKGDCKMVDADNPAELVRLLREEAKII